MCRRNGRRLSCLLPLHGYRKTEVDEGLQKYLQPINIMLHFFITLAPEIFLLTTILNGFLIFLWHEISEAQD